MQQLGACQFKDYANQYNSLQSAQDQCNTGTTYYCAFVEDTGCKGASFVLCKDTPAGFVKYNEEYPASKNPTRASCIHKKDITWPPSPPAPRPAVTYHGKYTWPDWVYCYVRNYPKLQVSCSSFRAVWASWGNLHLPILPSNAAPPVAMNAFARRLPTLRSPTSPFCLAPLPRCTFSVSATVARATRRRSVSARVASRETIAIWMA